MLLEFKSKNYRSFKDGFVFSLEPDCAKKELEYSILYKELVRKKYRALSSSVIYGPNAAGKTNIIGAMDTFKKILNRGNLDNEEIKGNFKNFAAYDLALIPNNSLKKAKPVEFSIKFIVEELLVEYTLLADLGLFIEKDYKRKVLKEELKVNDTVIFSRNEKLEFGTAKALKKYASDILAGNQEAGYAFAQAGLKDKELFLVNGFKEIVAKELAEKIIKWIDSNLMVIYDANHFRSIMQPLGAENFSKSTLNSYKMLNNFAKTIGVNSNILGYLQDDESKVPRLYSIFDNIKAAIPAGAIESLGTIRLINMLLPLLDALVNGKTLVVDEFDSSLHPMVVMNLINIFHNPDVNKNNAQLVFNTHNPIFLNSNLFRRDEIKFVEREDDKYSVLYSLADFSTSGPNSVRRTTDYMKNYFVSRYGAIKEIDFTPLFEALVNSKTLVLNRDLRKNDIKNI